MRHFLSLVLLSLLAIFLANGTIAPLHKILPQEFSRTAFLIETSQKGMEAEAVIFGNSIAMSGINAGRLAALSNSIDLAYNLASNGQYLNESILYYPSVQAPTTLVVQMLRSTELSQPFKKIDRAVLRNFYFGGYNFNTDVEQLFKLDLGLNYTKNRGNIFLKNDHRGLLVNSLNTILKNGLRSDMKEKEKETDLIFPNIYTKQLPQDKLQILINKYNPPKELKSFDIHPDKAAFIYRAQKYFAGKGIKYVVAILPFHDGLTSYSPNYKYLVNQRVERSQLPIVSLIDDMAPEEFVDHCHLSKQGASHLTDRLYEELKKQGHAF